MVRNKPDHQRLDVSARRKKMTQAQPIRAFDCAVTAGKRNPLIKTPAAKDLALVGLRKVER